MRRIKESLSEKIFKSIGEKSLDFLDLGLKIMFNPRELIKEYGFSLYKDYAFSKVIYNLKRSSYFIKQDENFYVTEKGRMKIIRSLIRNKKCKEKNRYWFGIIFDIPEANRKERSFLRRELSMAGCRELQKSVWITPFNIEKELLALLMLWRKDFKGDIKFLKIQKISEENKVRKLFP
jgi:hypothetical protein